MMASAPRVWALATNLSRVTGTNSMRAPGRQIGTRLRHHTILSERSWARSAAGDADAGQDLGRVLAELRRRPAQGAGRGRQARDDVVHGDAADLLVGDIDHDLPRLHVRVGDELVDVVDRRRRHLGRLEDGQALRADRAGR